MLKRLFCKHSWFHIEYGFTLDDEIDASYGCKKCGTSKWVRIEGLDTWKFKRSMKGDTFE